MSFAATLKGHDLFRSISFEQVDKISGFSHIKKFRRNETVYSHDAHATHVFMLITGAVHLRLPAKPAELSMVVSKVEPGRLFGIAPLLGGQRYTVTAFCVEECEVLAIEAKPFMAMLKDNPLVGYQVMSAVAKAYSDRYVDVLKQLQGIVNQITFMA
jgi:signal-transduction protein with cAMP-binding, CBS, and nucleotidyltransferase domain